MEVPLNMRPSSNLSSAQTSLTAQSSNFFQNAAGFEIVGGQFILGDVHNVSHNPDPDSVPTDNALPSLNIMDDTFSESEIYCNQLLRRRRGFPLYVPEPRRNLHPEYRKVGVQIGDVGRVTPEGVFDFFFNIYLPSDHPINANIPEDFSPMPMYTLVDLLRLDYDPGNYVSTSSIQKLDLYPELEAFPGGDFVFSCVAPQGAVLALPHGAHLEKLENLETIRDYAATYAESWYKYINGPRGRGLANGSLYLVTGWEKARSWGMASFHSVSDEFQLAFRPTLRADSTSQYRWSGTHGSRNTAQKKSYDPSPTNDGPLNQTTFIHGLSISLGTGIWGKLFEKVKICEIMESQSGNANGNSMVHNPSQGSSLWPFGFLGGGGATGGKTRVVLSDLSPISKIFHPGELINSYILSKALEATVVMSHDDDWSDILQDDPGTGSRIQNVAELLERVNEQFDITEKNGTAFLVKSESSISVSICPPTPPAWSIDASGDQNSSQADVVITVEAPPDDSDSPCNRANNGIFTIDSLHSSDRYPIPDPASLSRIQYEHQLGARRPVQFPGVDKGAKDLSRIPCKFYKARCCNAGSSCPFSHSVVEPGGKETDPHATSRQRTRSFNSNRPIRALCVPLRVRAHSDTTASRPHFNLQFNQLEGSAVEDGSSSSPTGPSPSSSSPSSPARSSHHQHSPTWATRTFLATPDPQMYTRSRARGSDTSSIRSSTPNLDWDGGSPFASDLEDMEGSPHSPIRAWTGGALLAPPATIQRRPHSSSLGGSDTSSNRSSSPIHDGPSGSNKLDWDSVSDENQVKNSQT